MGTRSCSTGRGSAARAGWTAATSCSSSRSSCTAGAAGGSMMPAWSFAGGCRLWDPGMVPMAAGAPPIAGGLPLPRRRAREVCQAEAQEQRARLQAVCPCLVAGPARTRPT